MDASDLPQTPRYERKREIILEAAAALFNAHGLGGTTIADVARSVGLTTTSVTYYYRRKEDLAAACLMRSLAAMDALITRAEADADSPPARLTRLLALYFEELAATAEGRIAAGMNFWDIRALTGPAAATTAAAFIALFRRIRALFREPHASGRPEPRFSHAERNSRAHLVFSALIRSKGWVVRYEAADYPRAAARMADILIHGLAGPGRVWAPVPLRLCEPAREGHEVSRETFLRAATELLNEHGYRGASVERISARLNVTKGSFYHHNDTKDDLVAACFGQTFAVIRQAHAVAMAGGGDGWTQLCSIPAALLRHHLSANGPLLRLSALSATAETLRPGLLATFTRLTEKTAGLIADGIGDGSIRPVDATIAAEMVNGMVNAAVELNRWWPATTMDNAAELFARPLLTGVFNPGR